MVKSRPHMNKMAKYWDLWWS